MRFRFAYPKPVIPSAVPADIVFLFPVLKEEVYAGTDICPYC